MKKDIHPDYKECVVTCGCGNTFTTGSTREKIAIEVCSNCHPFYTGKQKFVDTAGMVEKFQRKWASQAAQKAKAETAKPAPKGVVVSAAGKTQATRASQTLAAQFGAPKQAAPPPKPAAAPPAAAKPAPAPKPAEAKPAAQAPAKGEPTKNA